MRADLVGVAPVRPAASVPWPQIHCPLAPRALTQRFASRPRALLQLVSFRPILLGPAPPWQLPRWWKTKGPWGVTPKGPSGPSPTVNQIQISDRPSLKPPASLIQTIYPEGCDGCLEQVHGDAGKDVRACPEHTSRHAGRGTRGARAEIDMPVTR